MLKCVIGNHCHNECNMLYIYPLWFHDHKFVVLVIVIFLDCIQIYLFCIGTHSFRKVKLYILACLTKWLNLLARWCWEDIFLQYKLLVVLIFTEFINHIFDNRFFFGSSKTSTNIPQIHLTRIKKWLYHLVV